MNCYHDVSITGIAHDSQQNRLVMQTETEAQKKGSLAFIDVVGWGLSPFDKQNVLFDLQEFDAEALPDWIKSEFNIASEHLEALASGNRKLFFLDASNGRGGYVVASSIQSQSDKAQ